ncbi:hypothetical protein L293_0321 [Acinetobacter gyllenbergii CIP 110306 = MTCC 11365]|nr:hypothetical protein L293_0321 [Acinetobacter gyllenbergii CIP 110306 = MTCC 11365]
MAVAKKPSFGMSFRNKLIRVWSFIMCHLMIGNVIFIIK